MDTRKGKNEGDTSRDTFRESKILGASHAEETELKIGQEGFGTPSHPLGGASIGATYTMPILANDVASGILFCIWKYTMTTELEKENRYLERIMALQKAKRSFEVRTLDGYKPKHKLVPSDTFAKLRYEQIENEISEIAPRLWKLQKKHFGGSSNGRTEKYVVG